MAEKREIAYYYFQNYASNILLTLIIW